MTVIEMAVRTSTVAGTAPTSPVLGADPVSLCGARSGSRSRVTVSTGQSGADVILNYWESLATQLAPF